MDSFARPLDINDFWDRWMFIVLGVAFGIIKPDFWRDSNPVNMIVIPVWHYREIWRLLKASKAVN